MELKRQAEQNYPDFVTSLNLIEWTQNIKTKHKVAIFDTCASGLLGGALTKSPYDPSSATKKRSVKSYVENSGFYVLSGSTGDKESFEANGFGQGLLTRALLDGMGHPDSLENSVFLRVDSWFSQAVKETRNLAAGYNRIQEPVSFKSAHSRPFDIGRIDDEVRCLIAVPRRVPLIVKPQLVMKGRQNAHVEIRRAVAIYSYSCAP